MNRLILARGHPTAARRPARARPVLELLEDRTVLSSYTAANVTDLIADITAANNNPANLTGGTNTITLVAGNTFTLTAVQNTTDGGNGLPVITANDILTIVGNGDTIARSTASGTPAFRLFDVAAGASLTLTNLTLANGQVAGDTGVDAFGGGIYSSGSLTLTSVILSSNSAQGGDGQWVWDPDNLGGVVYTSPGGSAYGGGLYVAGGTGTLSNVTLSSNSARGGNGSGWPDGGGAGAGGGLYVAGGTVTLTSSTLSSNSAHGGVYTHGSPYYGGWPYGGGTGGGLYVAGGTVTLTSSTLSFNSAQGGASYDSTSGLAYGGFGAGGGLYVAGGTVTLTSSTLSSNSAIGGTASYYPGAGWGGALFAGGGTVTLRSDTVTGNSALVPSFTKSGGTKSSPGQGGGLDIDPVSAVSLDAFTLKHTKTNKPNDITGSYTLIP